MNHNETMHLLTLKTAERLRLANVGAMIAEKPADWLLVARDYDLCATAAQACANGCRVNAANAEARLERLALRRKAKRGKR